VSEGTERKAKPKPRKGRREEQKTKREYSELFNQLLGTDIDWTKLSLHELTQLAVLFNNPEALAKRLGMKLQNVSLRKHLIKIGESLGFKGPIMEFLKELWGESQD
jgi:hypothetical protein